LLLEKDNNLDIDVHEKRNKNRFLPFKPLTNRKEPITSIFKAANIDKGVVKE